MAKISETKEDLDVAMTQQFGPFLYGPVSLCFHPNAVRRNYKPNEAYALHIQLALQ
jgi:hypothetical protein